MPEANYDNLEYSLQLQVEAAESWGALLIHKNGNVLQIPVIFYYKYDTFYNFDITGEQDKQYGIQEFMKEHIEYKQDSSMDVMEFDRVLLYVRGRTQPVIMNENVTSSIFFDDNSLLFRLEENPGSAKSTRTLKPRKSKV